MNKIFRYSIAGAIALTQSIAMEITENTIIKSGEAFNWQGETEITIPAGKSLNIAGTMSDPGSTATIYLDGTLEAESTASINLENVTIKSKFLEDHPDLEQQETWDGVPVYQDSSGNFPKFEDAFYKPLTGKRLKVLNKLAGYSDWYEVAVLGDESNEDTEGQALSKIEELRQNLENLQQQIDDFNNAMDNLNGSNIATFAALNAQLAQASIMYSNENPYVNIDPDAKFILNKYAEFCQKDAEASANYTAEDKLNEPYAFCSAFQSFCWSFLSWKTLSLYDSSALSQKIRTIYGDTRENLTNYHGNENGHYGRQLEINEYEGTVFVWRDKLTSEERDLGWTAENNLFPATSPDGTKYYQTIHCHWIGDFTTEVKANWTYNGDGTFSAETSDNTYSYDMNTTTFTRDRDHWSLSLTHFQDIIQAIQNLLPTVEDSKSNQELQQLTARYYSTTPLSTGDEISGKTAYVIASQSTINLSKFRTIQILLDSESVDSLKNPSDLTSKVQNLDIESCLTVQLPFNSKFPTTLGNGIWNVTYQTLLTGATKNFKIGDDNVLTYTFFGGNEIGDYETNQDLQITLNAKETKKNRLHFWKKIRN